ncbi:cAMP-binding proteins-catabolite gene activator and regulatory subunit of cAMP-dependent protein kinases [hydrothermal vent metagenome]|uniref:cAMP-binding proteins-catabolite gene activator and regulatory subunit of cAMP-dependent protein kinases n=1 Tax=hydrothermal vent metagenome TaxID=652676 RepID=A0A1W1BUY0_9ZZZZ
MENIHELPLPFENLNQTLQTEVDKKAKTVLLDKGETPFLSNELEKYVYIVKKGKIKSYQLNLNNGKEQIIYIYRKNHIFDTVIVLDGQPNNLCYEVLENTTLLMFPIEFIRNLLYKYPEFSQKFCLYIAKQMRYLEEMITDISLYSTSERLIKLIIQDFHPSNIFKFNILEGLSHTDYAKLLGTVRHVVERHLRELKKEHIIDIVNKKIKILEAEKLINKIKLLG